MWNKFIEFFPLVFDKIKSWKDICKTILILIIVFSFNFVTKLDTEKYIINTKQKIVTEIAQKHDSLLSRTIEKSPEINNIINTILDNINETHDFNRSSIYVYHNNITMTNGMPYIRMSISHERIREMKMKVDPEMSEMQNIPSSMFAEINQELLKKGFVIRETKTLEFVDKNSYLRCLDENINGYIVILIRNTNNVPLAALFCYSYDTDIQKDMNTICDLQNQAKTIRNLLTY